MENESQPRQGSGCFKKGCIGCGIGALVLALIPVVVALLAIANRPGPEDPRSQELTQALPSLPGSPPPMVEAPEGDAPASPQPGTLESQELGTRLAADAEPVRLVLNLSKGSFQLLPAPAGQPIRVEADYDAERFKLEQHWDEADRRYEVRFDAKGGWLTMSGNRRSREKVRIYVPKDYPLVLAGSISMGESRLELGGLWVREVDLNLGMGAHDVTFSEPTSQTIEHFSIEGSMGEINITNLGNGSPRNSQITLSMGELDANLSGGWRTDAEVEVRCGMGECNVRTPDNVRVVVERASVGIGESRNRRGGEVAELPPGAPTLTLRASGSIGEVNVY